MKPYVAVFLSVFVAELGDKTQLATLLFAANPEVKALGVFLAAAAALTLSAGIAVIVGSEVGHWISPRLVKIVAGTSFLLIGTVMLLDRA